MSSLISDVKSSDLRVALNTTIYKSLLAEFKNACKESGLPMNTCLEAFMRQFVNKDPYKLHLPNDLIRDLIKLANSSVWYLGKKT